MAKRRDNSSPDPEDYVAETALNGMLLLNEDAYWRWLNGHLRQAENAGHTQRRVADNCNINEAQFSRYVNRHYQPNPRRHQISQDIIKLSTGLYECCTAWKLQYREFRPPTMRDLKVAGWLHALNDEGVRQEVPRTRRPLGVLHYYCLRVMFGNRAWYEAVAGKHAPALVNQMCSQVVERAAREAREVVESLEDYAAAERSYPIEPTHESLRDLIRTWIEPWNVVYSVMGDGP